MKIFLNVYNVRRISTAINKMSLTKSEKNMNSLIKRVIKRIDIKMKNYKDFRIK